MTTDTLRKHVIEECAAHLETVARQFIELAKELRDNDYLGAMSMSDIFGMAAREVRLLDPDNKETEERNRQRVKEWQQAIQRQTDEIERRDLEEPDVDEQPAVGFPDIEPLGPQKH
jgi:predicted transcriptional regulator